MPHRLNASSVMPIRRSLVAVVERHPQLQKLLVRWYQRCRDFVYLPVRGLAMVGDGVHCPVCEGRFRRYVRYRASETQDWTLACPRCDSLARHRLLWTFLLDNADIPQAPDILHFAPERALGARLATIPGANYVSADLYSERAKVRVDITDIPFGDASFDLVICSHVLEHVPDDHQAIKELRRVLRADGLAIVQVPIDQERPTTFEDWSVVTPHEREAVFGQKDHVRIYGRDAPSRLERAGFRVRQIRLESDLPSVSARQLIGLQPARRINGSDLFVCTVGD